MSHSKYPRIVALQQGHTYTYKIGEGGDLASMRGILKHGQEITLSPVNDFRSVQAGDIVFVKWRGGDYILHPVHEVQGDQFLIVNSLGKVNGWVHGDAILGKITKIVDPEPRPNVPEMLTQLQAAYRRLIENSDCSENEAHRFEAVVDDLRWYAQRIGPERWEKLPKPNKWSFASNLWYLTKRAAEPGDVTRPLCHYIDQGKWIVGFAAEALALFEQSDWEYLT